MSKNSSIQRGKLSDTLIGVVDNIRRTVHGALGTRPWAVHIVKRSWSGGDRGVGICSETFLELDPVPEVKRVTQDRMGPAGRESNGQSVLSKVSLRYTEAELAPVPKQNEEYAYRIRELHGQQQVDKFYVLATSPVPRRGDKPGDSTDWYILLNQTSNMGPMDGT